MKYGPLALSFDFGTQSVRAILFDKTGEIRGKEKIDYKRPYFSVKPGYCEQTADFYWDNMCTVSKMLKESSGEPTKVHPWRRADRRRSRSLPGTSRCRAALRCAGKYF